MPSLLQKLQALVTGAPVNAVVASNLKKLTERDLIRLESEIGRELFGPIPTGHRREFFCLDEHTWIWFEEWTDTATKKTHEITTRYEVHPNQVVKVQDNHPYQIVEGQELHNLALAAQLYKERVMRGVYGRDPKTGEKIPTPPGTMK